MNCIIDLGTLALLWQKSRSEIANGNVLQRLITQEPVRPGIRVCLASIYDVEEMETEDIKLALVSLALWCINDIEPTAVTNSV